MSAQRKENRRALVAMAKVVLRPQKAKSMQAMKDVNVAGAGAGQSIASPDGSRMKNAISSLYDVSASSTFGRGALWNWGYYDEELEREIGGRLPGFGQDGTDGYSEQLYYLALRTLPIPLDEFAGRSVLEVGCGNGRGLTFLSRVLDGARMEGVDLSPGAIRCANEAPGDNSPVFREGDAEQLPVDDGTFDVVINIESSHNYPDLGQFLREVHRVLKPGGYFSHVDMFVPKRYDKLQALKKEIPGLEWTYEADISGEVKAAIARRMAPGSPFRTRIKESTKGGLTGPFMEYMMLRNFGADFGGHVVEGPYIKTLRRLGVLKAGTRQGAFLASYRQHVARKGSVD